MASEGEVSECGGQGSEWLAELSMKGEGGEGGEADW